jgi:hypothetical protein
MKLNDFLEKIFKDGITEVSIDKRYTELSILIDTQTLIKNLNDVAIDMHNAIEEKRVYEERKDFKKIKLNDKQKRKIYKYLNI